MKAVVLSAAPADQDSLRAIVPAVRAELVTLGHREVESFELSTMKLGYCQGEFDCWVKTPGRCRTHDAEAAIIDAIHDADTLVLLGPVAFGGYDHVLKRAVDRFLCMLEPFFEKRVSLTHHPARYDRHQRLFSIGWAPAPSAELRRTFSQLNDANAVNFMAPACGAVVLDDADADGWVDAIRATLSEPRAPGAAIADRASLTEAMLAAASPDLGATAAALGRRAAILVGSPKPRGASVSELLARALERRLIAGAVATETHFATEFVHENERSQAAARSIAACDLLVLVTPLYVDSFPSLATRALELIAAARAGVSSPARFAAIVNCGFPEAEQNRTALRIAKHFAEQAGYGWAGGLPLGAGGALAVDRPLEDLHGPSGHVVRALDLAAPALAAGGVLPHAAIAAMAESFLPDAVYRAMGDLGWRWQAHQRGLAQRALSAKPLDGPPRER